MITTKFVMVSTSMDQSSTKGLPVLSAAPYPSAIKIHYSSMNLSQKLKNSFLKQRFPSQTLKQLAKPVKNCKFFLEGF